MGLFTQPEQDSGFKRGDIGLPMQGLHEITIPGRVLTLTNFQLISRTFWAKKVMHISKETIINILIVYYMNVTVRPGHVFVVIVRIDILYEMI